MHGNGGCRYPCRTSNTFLAQSQTFVKIILKIIRQKIWLLNRPNLLTHFILLTEIDSMNVMIRDLLAHLFTMSLRHCVKPMSVVICYLPILPSV